MHLCVPSSPGSKSATYVTAADFEDTVGDGISFSAGEFVTVCSQKSHFIDLIQYRLNIE